MVVHYHLFKHGKYYSHRDHAGDISIFDFVGPTHSNPVAYAINALVLMLMEPRGGGRSHLGLMLLKLGDNINEWPLRVVRAVQIGLLIGISVL